MAYIFSAHLKTKMRATFRPSSFCARDESRTHTSQLTLAPETSASTISPPALEVDCKYTEYLRNRKQNQARIHNLKTVAQRERQNIQR